MLPRCASDQADKRNVIDPTPVTAPFKDANRFSIYRKIRITNPGLLFFREVRDPGLVFRGEGGY